MKETYKKCILLFSKDDSRILIIYNDEDKAESIYRQESKNIDFVSFKNKLKNGTPYQQLVTSSGKDFNFYDSKLYDLIILDQVCDSPILCKNSKTNWETRQDMFMSLSKLMESNGSLIILTQNAINVQKASNLFNAIINLFVHTRAPGTFLHQFAKELKKAGFQKINYFYLYPDFNSFSNVISTDHKAFHEVISHKYGTPINIFFHPRFWLRWIFARAQLDRWLLCCQLILVKK